MQFIQSKGMHESFIIINNNNTEQEAGEFCTDKLLGNKYVGICHHVRVPRISKFK